ncbi:hypothetical protein AQ616_17730 [Oceanobacillus sp. E9]|uniref:hypothetical protein n=1 Tax=Oceanobacillus sp. E9 TaxID=1742575 RepID=UPI00084E4663|nr:hypothetical protein [Oceanobacillus sp. E9]OEH53120.1 hypothetical protein AQ616_17730 [Oceanobacillus sp. E9]
MKEIGIQRAIEEVSIDGTTYEIDLSDKKKNRYAEIAIDLQKASKESEKVRDINDVEVLEKEMNRLKEKTSRATDEILGDGAFDTIYKKTNESLELVLDVLFDVIDYINTTYKKKFEEKKAKYLKKKK